MKEVGFEVFISFDFFNMFEIEGVFDYVDFFLSVDESNFEVFVMEKFVVLILIN